MKEYPVGVDVASISSDSGSSSADEAAPKRRFSFTEKTARKQQMPMLRTAMLRAGSSFGEAALDTGLPRQATVRCEEKCWVAVLRRQDFHDVLMNCDTDSHRAWCSFAAAAPVLRELPEPVRVRLVAHCRTLQVEKAQRVCQLGEPVNEVVFLVEGNFQVFAQPGGPDTEAVATSLLPAPAVFGLSALLRNETQHREELRCASARGKVYMIPTKRITMMLTAHQQPALTKIALNEKRFHLARAGPLRGMKPLRGTGSRLYHPRSRLRALRRELRASEADLRAGSEGGSEVVAAMGFCWSAESIGRARAESQSAKCNPTGWKMPPMVSAEPPSPPKKGAKAKPPPRRLLGALRKPWAPQELAALRRIHAVQSTSVFHGYGPPKQANTFLTNLWYKEHSGPWSQARLKGSVSASGFNSEMSRGGLGWADVSFLDDEDEDQPEDLGAAIKERLRQKRLRDAKAHEEETCAVKIQHQIRGFLRKRQEIKNRAVIRIQRFFRRRAAAKEFALMSDFEESFRESHLMDAFLGVVNNFCKSATLTGPLDVEGIRSGVEDDKAKRGHPVLVSLELEEQGTGIDEALARRSRSRSRKGLRSPRSPRASHSPQSSRSPRAGRDREEDQAEGFLTPTLPPIPPASLAMPFDLAEKHRVLVETKALSWWSEAAPELRRKLPRRFDGLRSSRQRILVESEDGSPFAAYTSRDDVRLPLLPPQRSGPVIFSERIARADCLGDRGRPDSQPRAEDVLDPRQIYRLKPNATRERLILKRRSEQPFPLRT